MHKYQNTNLPLDVIYDSLRSLIIKMFANRKAVSIMVNPNRKKTIWSNGSNYAGYREYTMDELLEALEIILFNTFIHLNGCICKQILGIPMGGNAFPFIADLYLSWCEYCYMTKIVKTDYAMAKLLSYNCRYLDDICTVNFKYLGDIAIYIYDSTLLLEDSACSYKQDTFLDLYIRVVDGKFVTGIYHKVDDFNFEVVNYPLPQSNIHSMLGYTTFYSQLICFFRLCNNINDFLFRAKLSYSKLVKRGYIHSLLFKYFKRFCLADKIEEKFGEKDYKLLFSCMIKYSLPVSCDINSITSINTIVKTCSVKITTATKVKDTCINKPPLPTDLFEFMNTPIPCITTTNIDDVEGSNPYSLRDIAKCSTLPYENIPLLNSWEMKIQITLMCQEKLRHLAIWLPLFYFVQTYAPLRNYYPQNHCYMNSAIQLLFSILRTISQNFQFNSIAEGSISKFLFE